jgi:hypothetical protein
VNLGPLLVLHQSVIIIATVPRWMEHVRYTLWYNAPPVRWVQRRISTDWDCTLDSGWPIPESRNFKAHLVMHQTGILTKDKRDHGSVTYVMERYESPSRKPAKSSDCFFNVPHTVGDDATESTRSPRCWCSEQQLLLQHLFLSGSRGNLNSRNILSWLAIGCTTPYMRF